MNTFELTVLDAIQQVRCPILDALVPWITALGDKGIVWIALAAILIVIPRTRRVGMAVGVSLLIELVLCNLFLKPLIARPRPFSLNSGIGLLVEPLRDFSFPSGHTGAAFACAVALLIEKSRLWIPVGMLAIVMGLTRLYLYVHYPTDVLAGAVLGALSAWAGCALMRRLAARRS